MTKIRTRRPLSLTTRVMIAVALAIGLSLFVIGHLVQNVVERHFAEQDAGELVVMTSAVERALLDADNEATRLVEALSHAVSGHHGVYFQVWDMDGNLIYGPDGSEFVKPINKFPVVPDTRTDNLYRWQADGKTYRGTITQTLVGSLEYRIVTAIDMNFHIQFLNDFRRSLLLIMTLAGIITLLAAWYGVHQGHAPLRGLSDTMRDVQSDRLHVRLNTEALPGELQNLATSFNHMIGRLEDSFTRMSHFSADIAHELRTPLTNLITQTQVALGKARSLDEYRELLYSNLEEQERLAKMVNDMLWLAQSEHGLLKPVPESLDLAHEVQELFDFFEALAEEKLVRLELEGKAPRVEGDRSMLRRAISNLLSNAIRYTTAGDRVLVRLEESGDGRTLLSVQNSGPDIPDEHLASIFERFYRIDPSRNRQSEGAGLGLAIVRSIMEAHGGKVEASSDDGVSIFRLAFGSVE
jgi:two-component system heavy metal sensor histidine kinase CusS